MAVVWGAIASIAASLIGGALSKKGADAQSDAAEKAGSAQLEAARMAIWEQKRQFDATRSDLQPYMMAGRRGLSAMERELYGPGFNPMGKDGFNKYAQFAPQAPAQNPGGGGGSPSPPRPPGSFDPVQGPNYPVQGGAPGEGSQGGFVPPTDYIY